MLYNIFKVWDVFYRHVLLVFLLEIAAAAAGSYYLWKTKKPSIETKLLVYYLWLVIFVEVIGLYPTYAYFDNYETLPFLENTVWERNFWWYNIYHILKFGVFYYYFIRQLKIQKRKNLYILSAVIIIGFILYLIFSGEFFYQMSTMDAILGTIFLTILIFLYYIEVLSSDKILVFYKNLPFYVSVGILIWHLIVTPLFIYSKYFSTQSPYFVELHSSILKGVNIFLYGIFILGFLTCAKMQENEEKVLNA